VGVPEVELLAGLSTLCFVLVAGVVGTRLLLLARRTRQTPELAIGLALILVVFVGYPLRFVPARLELDLQAAKAVLAFGLVVTAIGQSCVYVFTRAVFRPEAGWARALVGTALATITALAFASLASLVRDTDPMALQLDRVLLVTYVVYTLGYVWTASEAFRYHGLLRRRRALGLADPVVTNRFLLWGISGSAATVGLAVSIGVALASDGRMTGHSVSMLVLGVAGVTSAVTTYLAFMPPTAWVRWIAGPTPVASA